MWTAEEIKSLRLRLGWSAADFARRFGCTSEMIMDWERGAMSPSPDDVLQLSRLEFHLESYCEQVVRGPVADVALSALKLNQIYKYDVTAFQIDQRRHNS